MALALLWTPAASAQLSCGGGVSGNRVAHLAVRPAQLVQDAFEDVTIAMRNNKLPPRLGEQSTLLEADSHGPLILETVGLEAAASATGIKQAVSDTAVAALAAPYTQSGTKHAL